MLSKNKWTTSNFQRLLIPSKMALQPSLNPIVSFFESNNIFTQAARRTDRLYMAKGYDSSKSSTHQDSRPSGHAKFKTPTWRSPTANTLEHHAGWRIAPAKVDPPVKRPAEKEEEAFSYLLVLTSQMSFDDGHTSCAFQFS